MYCHCQCDPRYLTPEFGTLRAVREALGFALDDVIAFERPTWPDYETIKVSNFVIPQVPSR